MDQPSEPPSRADSAKRSDLEGSEPPFTYVTYPFASLFSLCFVVFALFAILPGAKISIEGDQEGYDVEESKFCTGFKDPSRGG